MAVAVQGDALYDCLLQGTYPANEADLDSESLPTSVTVDNSVDDSQIIPLFAN
jgi:hypothetical protein